MKDVKKEKEKVLIQRELFDYTEWRKKLWKDKTVQKISSSAMEYRRKEEKNP